MTDKEMPAGSQHNVRAEGTMSTKKLTAEEYRIAAKVLRADGMPNLAETYDASADALTPPPADDEPTREEIEHCIATYHPMGSIWAKTLRRVWRDKLVKP